MSDATWQVSSTYVSAFSQSLRALGLFEAVHAKAPELLVSPNAQRWWPGADFVALLQACEAAHGRAQVIAANVRTSHERMGPLVKPLASVLLALSSTPTAALLKRLPAFLEAGVRGVSGSSELRGDGATVRFVFPSPVPEVTSAVWHGLFDVGFSIARQGEVVSEVLAPTQHTYEIRW